MKNAETIDELQTMMFGLLKEPSIDIRKKGTMTQFASAPPIVAASETESTRFKAAAYRFSVFCLLQTSEARKAFLKRYPIIQVLELSHFASALWTLVSVIRGRSLETDRDWKFLSNIMSTGPDNILQLWKMKQNALAATHNWASMDFKLALKEAGMNQVRMEQADDDGDDNDLMGEWCNLMDAYDFPVHADDAILDEQHEHCVELLAASAGCPAKPLPPKTYDSDDDESSEIGTASDAVLGVVTEDCLEDPF
ncbi:hypothetical protein MSAN_00848900 [Mycena sanguinolenta]|uniref:Uncharacterized protein n=1 Tax=Mycena sanguinolenta TaxID=230812 RepID=A0A8H6YYZ2_9AGAR|nr:hypothetical protein MSAN_00848900 [Mycena sanguinolenta]